MLQGIMLCVVLFVLLEVLHYSVRLQLFWIWQGDRVQVLYFKDDEGVESMICFCSCTKSSYSPLQNLKQRESSKSCKSCGGKLPVDGRGSQQGSMLSYGGLELSNVIDPGLTWKKASNGRQRAVRRARTSFTGANGKNSSVKSLKVSKDLTEKNSKNTGDMPVSESEKVGVSILGRRFSDTVGSVPIKKRRFLLDHSPSPPHHSSSYLDDSGNVMERRIASYQGAVVNSKQHSLDVNSGSGSVFGQERNFGFAKTDKDGANEKICDAVDFSGISILAAAACDTNIGGELLNVECSLSKVHPLEAQRVTKEDAKLDFSPHEKEEAQPYISEDLVGRTDLPFEASSSSGLPSKESNEVKSDGLCNIETSVNLSQNVPNTTTESSSHDLRFHWDLNTAADAWESHEEVLNSDREASHMSKDADHNDKLGNAEPFMDQVGFGDTKLVLIDDSQLVDSRDNLGGEQKMICASEMKTEVQPGISSDNSPADSKESKPLFSNGEDSPAEELHLTEAKTGVEDVCEETKFLSNKDQSSFLSGGAVSVVGAVNSLLCDPVLEEENAEAGKTEGHCVNFHSKVETESSPSRLVSCDDAIVDHPTSVSGSHHQMDKRSIESGTDVQMEAITHTSSPQDVKHKFLFVNPGAVETDGNSLVCHLAEKGSEMLADGNKCKNMVTGCVISGGNPHMNALDETYSDNADKSKEKDVCECETAGVETKMDNTSARNDDMDVAENDFPSDDIGFEVSACKLPDITPGDDDPQPALSSQGACKNSTDDSANIVASENHLDSHYCPDASQNDADQAPGMEKVEFLGDDDSQYEDGEFRESLANCWLDDGEEVETERVDYGSDRDTDVCDASSDFSSVNRQVNSVGLPDASHDIQYREAGKEDTQNASGLFLNCTLLANVSDGGSGTRNAGAVTGGTGLQGNLRTYEKDSSEGNDVGDNGFFKEADDAGRSSRSASFRKKSGWDRLPGGCRSSNNGVTNSRLGSINRNRNDSSSDPGDSMNRAVGSSLRRDLSSRIESVQSSDISCRNDKSYVRSSRSNDRNGFNPRVERARDDPRPIGRSGPSMHLQGRSGGDHWVDSSNHHGNNRHDSSGYYGPASFSHHGSSNAAAAAVAKVESNGFVVAPDGTIVKAGGAGSAGHLTRRSAKPSSQNPHRSPMGRGSPIERDRPFGMHSGPGRSREMIPDRPMFAGRGKPDRYSPEMDSASHRERNRGPVPDSIIDSSSMHHTISRRDHSFSPPHRRPLHLSQSHSRSPSRSRTRSPHRWASPRGRGDSGMNGGPGLRRLSRSPNFKPDARMGRPRAGFGEHIVSYALLSRNHTSPPHASRWIDGGKEAPEHFREYEYRRCPGRSPPARVVSRGHRFDLMDSPGRLKPDEYCRPTNSGRFPGFVGFGRGSRHDGKGDDRREHGDRMLHSTRQYVYDGNMKRLRYGDENGFIAQNPRPKSSEFQRRDSPRAYNRSTERQLGDSPRRSKEEKGHIINVRDGNHNANFKSFGVRDGDDNMDAQRRPL